MPSGQRLTVEQRRETLVAVRAEDLVRFFGRQFTQADVSPADLATVRLQLDRARGGKATGEQRQVPDEIAQVLLDCAPLSIGTLLKRAGRVPTSSEGLRLVEQGGVRIDGERIGEQLLPSAAQNLLPNPVGSV